MIKQLMMKLFYPQIYCEHFKAFPIDLLIKRKIKVLIIDLDNTLIAHDEEIFSKEAKAFIVKLKKSGFKLVVVSNNFSKRVKKLAMILQIDYYSFSLKPLKHNLKKIITDYNVSSNEVAIYGDQLITDICGGNRLNYLTILQDPLVKSDNTSGKITRLMEKIIFNYFEKKHIITKGEYYD